MASAAGDVRHDVRLLTEMDFHLFNEGNHFRVYEKLGSHVLKDEGGTCFAVWAPNAESVSVVGNFNGWAARRHPLHSCGASGLWEGFVPGIGHGEVYKYHIESKHGGYQVDKADPFAFRHETLPSTASIVWNLDYEWKDSGWMRDRRGRNALNAPISIYEVHLGSWRRVPEENHRMLSYKEIAPLLVEHVKRTGFTHVEFLPVMEHPFYGSWGYQVTGFFAPTGRYGSPQDLMVLVDELHKAGIGVILDWVPSHFPADQHGLAYFDGTHLFEHADPRQGFHPDWGSSIFNYGRDEVRSFLISSALFWLDRYHVDGLRVDGVASMLYLDYSRKNGDWIPNQYGGRENLGAITLLRRLNEEVYRVFPDVQTYAEESTAWPMVSRPTSDGGLGFGFKWDMGWTHDMLDYIRREPVHRSYHHSRLTFRMLYAFHENFVLPLSHDEVVHGKGPLLGKMPGDLWRRFANVRLLLATQYAQSGKKLLFMGNEFAQGYEWTHDTSLHWHLLQYPEHAGVMQLVADLNKMYREERALHEADLAPAGFEWVDCHDARESTVSLLRRSPSTGEVILAAFNFTPVPRRDRRIGVPVGGLWREILNTDAREYAGSGLGNAGAREAEHTAAHGRPFSLKVTLPPLGAVFFKAPPPAKPSDAAATPAEKPSSRK